jgi:flagellar hook-length control protein FliK
MIGGALMPKATLPTPATPAHEPHAASPHAGNPHADFAHEAHAPAHHGERERGGTRREDETPVQGEHAQRSHHPQQTRAASRTQRSARRAHDAHAEGDEPPAHDTFARLLDQAPVAGDAAKPAAIAPTAVTTTAPETEPDPRADAKTASLPDQLLCLLASLAPTAQPASATVAPTPAAPASAQTPTLPTGAPIARPAAPPVGADAAATLLPTLQTAGSAAAAATDSTPGLAALHAEDASGAAVPTLRDGNHAETPAPTPFDALVRATAPTAPDAPRPVLPATPAPVLQPTDPRAGYGDELGAGVVWMADQRISHAEVRVVPEHLGPIDVRLQLDGAQVHATFLSAQPEVRHALEASLPRLRDLLGQHGLQLAQADVGQRQQDPRATRGDRQPAADRREAGDDGLVPMPSSAHARIVRGLLDEYA